MLKRLQNDNENSLLKTIDRKDVMILVILSQRELSI